MTTNEGHIDPGATPSQIMSINLPDYFATNSGARNTEGWAIYPGDNSCVAVMFGPNDPVIFLSLAAALEDIAALRAWEATEEDGRLAETLVPAFRVAKQPHPYEAA